MYGKAYRGEELRAVRLASYGLKDLTPVVDDPELNALAFDKDFNGRLVGIGFAGNRKRPDWYYTFRTEEERAAYREKWLKRLREQAEAREAEKVKAKQPHSLEVGSILYSSWGYEQTNIDFYQVTKLLGKTMVEIRKIRGKVVSKETGAWYVAAVPDAFIEDEEPMRKRVKARWNSVTLTSYSDAGPWNGKPLYETAPGWGH